MTTRKKTLAVIALIFISFFVFAGTKGSGKTASESRELNPFDAVELNIPADVSITKGEQQFELTADDNLLSAITTKVNGTTLEITTKSNVNFKAPVKIAISLPDVKRVAIHGSGSFRVDAINTPDFTADINGSGRITAAGSTQTGRFEIAGSGSIAAEQLAVRQASANIAGSGEIHMGETGKLNSTIAGSGTITYAGDPSLESNIYGSGKVVARR